jgi:hypothetical protein
MGNADVQRELILGLQPKNPSKSSVFSGFQEFDLILISVKTWVKSCYHCTSISKFRILSHWIDEIERFLHIGPTPKNMPVTDALLAVRDK